MSTLKYNGAPVTINNDKIFLSTGGLSSGIPSVGLALQNVSFVDAGITQQNIKKITKIGIIPQSFDPNRQINRIKDFEENCGYYIISKEDLDLTTVVLTSK